MATKRTASRAVTPAGTAAPAAPGATTSTIDPASLTEAEANALDTQDAREDTDAVQNRIDMNDPTLSGTEAVQKNLEEG